MQAAHAGAMFCVTEAEAAAIRTAFDEGGEFSAAVELRRIFPGILDNVKARYSPAGSRCRPGQRRRPAVEAPMPGHRVNEPGQVKRRVFGVF
jgi:hypothetical protein